MTGGQVAGATGEAKFGSSRLDLSRQFKYPGDAPLLHQRLTSLGAVLPSYDFETLVTDGDRHRTQAFFMNIALGAPP